MTDSRPLWTPQSSRKESSQLTAFAKTLPLPDLGFDYAKLHDYSIHQIEEFWAAAADYFHIRWQTPPTRAVELPAEGMRGAKWFPGGKLSYVTNMLRRKSDSDVRIISIVEGRREDVRLTGAQIYTAVARVAAQLRTYGIGEGDRVAAILPNTPEAIIAMLATNALGAIWSSCSPDFGEDGIVDRFGQIEPKVLIATKHYIYNGKTIQLENTVQKVLHSLPTVMHTIVVDPLGSRGSIGGFLNWEEVLRTNEGAEDDFEPLAVPFDHPLYILYSSGTTGQPKCIVHTVGGALLQHKKELMLHSDIGPGKRLLYFTTCGWMMWNWMASALSTGASIVLFEGSVTREDCKVLWRVLRDEEVTCFGTSAKFIATSIKEGVEPGRDFKLPRLETILSTGSPLLPEHFAWVYGHVKPDLHLASISGGTDIVSCFMLGNPWSPVYAGEIQGPGLGMAVECWNDDGQAVRNEKGELVCTKPFPAMPLGFWQDYDNSRYKESYFSHYPGTEVWRHGDFIEINDHLGITVFGRSDATLNPGGVRIGTAEIYRQVEQNDEVLDSLAISHEKAGDAEMILFVKLKPGKTLTAELEKTIKSGLRQQLSPRHVPAAMVQVSDIPYTRSGKKLELAVTRIFQGRAIDNQTAIANPESLEDYRKVAQTFGAPS